MRYSDIPDIVKDGWYEVIIDRIDFGFSRSLYPNFVVRFMITDGIMAGQFLMKRMWMHTPRAMEITMKDFESLGFRAKHECYLEEIQEKVIGKRMSVRVVTNPPDAKKLPRFRSVYLPRAKRLDGKLVDGSEQYMV